MEILMWVWGISSFLVGYIIFRLVYMDMKASPAVDWRKEITPTDWLIIGVFILVPVIFFFWIPYVFIKQLEDDGKSAVLYGYKDNDK